MMILSVTRTISIKVPLYRIQKYWVLSASLLYSCIILLEPLVGVIDRIDYKYIYNGNNPNCFQKAAPGVPYYFQYFLEATNILLISVVTFVSFIVTMVKLYAASSNIKRCVSDASATRSQRKFHQASIAVAIFTATFLVCNLPMFANVVMASITTMHFSYPGPIFSVFYMNYYSWVVSKVVCVVLNAGLNPVLYFLRMGDFNRWIRKGRSNKPSITYSDNNSKQ